MRQRFFSLFGAPIIAFVACLATANVSASTGTGHIVYDLSDIAIEQDGLLKPALNRGRNSNPQQNEIRMGRQCPCGPKCQCPADCTCHSGGPCSHQRATHQQGSPANPTYVNKPSSGYEHRMTHGNGPMYVQMVPVGGYGQSRGHGRAGRYSQQPILVQVLPSGYGPGMVQESGPYQPTLMPEDISYVQAHGITARRVKRQMERQNAAGCRADRRCTVYPYDETWSGWQVYSLFDKVHNSCQAVPARCDHYQPHFSRGRWHTITTLMPYYIKHLRVGYSH